MVTTAGLDNSLDPPMYLAVPGNHDDAVLDEVWTDVWRTQMPWLSKLPYYDGGELDNQQSMTWYVYYENMLLFGTNGAVSNGFDYSQDSSTHRKTAKWMEKIILQNHRMIKVFY